MTKQACIRMLVAIVVLVGFQVCMAAQSVAKGNIANQDISSLLNNRGATFQLSAKGLTTPVFTSRVGAEIDYQWLWSTDYPTRTVTQSSSQDVLGNVHRITVRLSGLPGKPELSYTVEVYDNLPFGDIQVYLKNPEGPSVGVQDIRVIDIVDGSPRVNLGGTESSERVLSDSYSEDRPPLHIFDLGKARKYEGEDSYSDARTNCTSPSGVN